MYHQPIESDGLTYAPATQARQEGAIIEQYLPLVRKIAWHVHASQSVLMDVEDMVQIGLAALIEAARTYEDKGASFAGYAATRVRGAMIDQLRRVATVSRRGMANKREIERARRTLENRIGRSASHDEVAAEMGLEPENYFEKCSSAQSMDVDSIDEAYSDASLLFADMSEDAATGMERQELVQQMSECIAELPEREAMILQLYFIEERNLAEIAEILGIGSARVSQLKKRVLAKVRERMEARQAA